MCIRDSYLLARSTEPDPQYTDAKTYVLGDRTVGPFEDGHYRRVYSSTVMLRNTANLSLLN